jgi:hypothetical protein
MDRASELILALHPVTFHYKSDKTNTPQFGLIAEEVEKVNPNLVIRDKEGKPYSVRYDQVNAMLLNEFLKEHKKVEEQSRELHEQGNTMRRLNTVVLQQQQGIEALTAQIEEQAAELRRVSAQIEASRSAPQLMASHR